MPIEFVVEERIPLRGPMEETGGDYGYMSGFGNTHSPSHWVRTRLYRAE